ncbi:MAG: DUF3379 family protein [Gammaproteobacteria bacterium]
MNCLEYRRTLLERPTDPGSGAREHQLACRACADWTTQQQRFEQRLAYALSVPVPEGVAERVMLHAAWRSPRPHWQTIAATVAAVTLGALLAIQLADQPVLAQSVLTHVYDEPDLLIPGSEPVDPARLKAVLERVGGTLDGTIGSVLHAGLCPVGGKLAAHLVVAGEHGPIAVLVMPEYGVATNTAVGDDKLHGAIVPVGRGSVAVIGFRGESLDVLAERVRTQLSIADHGA